MFFSVLFGANLAKSNFVVFRLFAHEFTVDFPFSMSVLVIIISLIVSFIQTFFSHNGINNAIVGKECLNRIVSITQETTAITCQFPSWIGHFKSATYSNETNIQLINTPNFSDSLSVSCHQTTPIDKTTPMATRSE